MIKISILLMLLAFLSNPVAQTSATLSGKVVDPSGNGISSCTIRLINADVSVSTVSGEFTFSLPTSINRQTGESHPPYFAGNNLQVNTGGSELLNIEIFNGAGKNTGRYRHNLKSAGQHSIPVTGPGDNSVPGILSIRVSQGDQTYVFKKTQGLNFYSNQALYPEPGLMKKTLSIGAATPAIDTLSIQCFGFLDKKVPVSEFDQTLPNLVVRWNLGSPGYSVRYQVEQITFSPADGPARHHFFGYIGHSLTIPWNESGRYIVALRTDFYKRMPDKGETADIILIDTYNDYGVTVVDKTRGWNLQQGTMLYWNPGAPETQFFFNDSDESGAVWTVLFDITTMTRVKEYKFGSGAGANHAIANGGIAPDGSYFAGINYGKASMRQVISYADATDETDGNPDDDGLFKVDIATGVPTLLLSYKDLAAQLGIDYPIYFHHTLWNRDNNRISFIVRGPNGNPGDPNLSFVIGSDGEGAAEIPKSGHPEWAEGPQAVMTTDNGLEFYNVDTREVEKTIGPFNRPDDDKAYSPDGKWFVVSDKADGAWRYQFYRFSDDTVLPNATTTLERWAGGGDDGTSTRIDGAPRWNRTSDAILVGGVVTEVGDSKDTRQLAIIRLMPGD